MPKRMLLIALALSSLALAACGATYNPNDLYGTPEPTASPTPPTTPNPTISSSLVKVTSNGVAIDAQPVNLYTDVDGHTGTLILTQTTNASGETTFNSLTPAKNYCFNSVYTPAGSTSLTQSQTICTDLWGFGITIAF